MSCDYWIEPGLGLFCDIQDLFGGDSEYLV